MKGHPHASRHVGWDLAKHVFQIHGIDAAEKVVVRKPLRRSQVIAFCEALPPCLVGMEACATAHYWARELTKLSHEVRLMPAKDVKAYVKRNKNYAERLSLLTRRRSDRAVVLRLIVRSGNSLASATTAFDIATLLTTPIIAAEPAPVDGSSLSKTAHGRRKMGATDDGKRPVPGHVSLAVKPNQPEDDGKYGVPDVALPNAAVPLA
jgi:hypothetical protein